MDNNTHDEVLVRTRDFFPLSLTLVLLRKREGALLGTLPPGVIFFLILGVVDFTMTDVKNAEHLNWTSDNSLVDLGSKVLFSFFSSSGTLIQLMWRCVRVSVLRFLKQAREKYEGQVLDGGWAKK